MRENRRITAWSRFVLSLFSALGIFALAACGGGSGAPNNPYAPIPVFAPLSALPSSPTIYAKIPSSLTISGGTAPYRAFSSNTTILPVQTFVNGSTVPLLAGPVTGPTDVSITIQDSAGQQLIVPVTVLPELTTPPPALVVLPTTLDAYPGVPTQLAVSGGQPPYRAFSTNPGVLPVALNVTNNVVPLLAATVATDTVVMITVQDAAAQTQTVNVTVHSQPATPPPALSVQPSTLDIQAGVSTQITITGGVAPYRAFSSNPVVLPVTQNVTGNSLPILASDVAANTAVTLTIQDSANQTAVVNVTVRPRPVTPPPALNVQPSTLDIQAGVSTQITITGGVPPYRAFSSNPGVLPVAQNVTGNSVPILASDVAATTFITLTIQDSAGQTVQVNVTVRPRPITPPPALSLIPAALDVTSGIAAQLTIIGGVAPYRAFSSNSAILAVPQDVVGNTVNLVASPVTLTCSGILIVICDPPPVVNITIQDAAGQTAVAVVTVHPQTPPTPLSVQPSALDLTAGVSTQLTISGGVAPYRAFSSNPGVLPVTQTVTGNTVALLASDVAANTVVTITIQDSVNQTALVTVTVRPSPVTTPPPLTVQPTEIELLSGISSQVTIISGVPPYRAFTSNPAVLPVTQAVAGNTVPLQAADVASATVVTLTIQDGANRTATVKVTVSPRPITPPPALVVLPTAVDAYSGIATQVAVTGGVGPYRAFSSNTSVLPVTESVAGNVVPLLAGTVTADTRVVLTVQDSTGQSAVVNVTVHPRPTTPPPALSLIPAVLDVTSGVASTIAIAGGVAPYRAFSSNSAILPVTQDVPGSSVSLLAAQVECRVTNNLEVCPTVNITVQDSVGQTAVAVVTVHAAPTTPPPALSVLPTTLELFPNVTTTMLISGGVPPYHAFSSNPAVLPVTTNVPANNTVTLVAAAVAADTRIVITIQDSSGQTKEANVTVHPTPTTPAAPLTVIPTSLDAYSGITTQVAIDGGQPPYRAFSSNTAVLPVTDPVVGNIVPLVPGNVTANTAVTLIIRDSAGQSVNVTVTVHPASITPPTPLTVLPTALDAYSGIATQVAVDGGTPPYRAFSSNTAVLPVTDPVVGNVVPLVPGNVTANTPVTLIIRDAGGQSQVVNVTVHPASITPPTPLTVVPTTLDAYSGIATQVAVDGGTPPYRAFSSNTAVLPVTDPVVGNVVPLVPGNVTANTAVTLIVRDAGGQSQVVNVTVHPAPTTPPTALIVLPSRLDVYAGIATQLTVSGGVAPYRAFSTNPAVITVAQSVTGNTIPIVAATVDADTNVTITVQDAVGQTLAVPIVVHPKPATPPPALSVLPANIEITSGIPAQLTIVGGVAPYTAFSNNSAVLPVTQSVTGNGVTLLAAPVTADTKVNITIQDAVGQTVVTSVTVHAAPNSPPLTLVVLPNTLDVYPNIASTLTISGGIAPYKAFSSNTAVLPVATNVLNNTVSLVAASVAVETRVVITIQDATGQTATVNATVHPAPATPALSVLPANIEVVSGSAAQLTIVGGVAPYSAFSSNSAVLPVTQSVTGNSVTLLAAPVTVDTKVNITIQDAVGQTVTTSVTVHPNPSSPPPTLVVLPNTLDVYPNIAAPLTISGGIAPYKAFSSNTAVLPVVTNVPGTIVTLLAAPVAVDTKVVITIQDSAGQTATVNATVHPTPATPPPALVVLPNDITVNKGVPATLTISGGLAPYKAYSSNPVVLPVTLNVIGNSVILVAAGVSADTNVTITVQDSAGQTVPVAVHVKADPSTPPPPLAVLPATMTIFGGQTGSLTVTGGTPPYQAFSSNPAVLPVTQAVAGNTIPFLAANVGASTAVTITVLDSDNKTATATVTVQPSTLVGSMTIVPNLADCGTTTVCSGQTASATVTVTAPGGGGLANRQIRFDVISGDYGILNGSTTVQSLTVASDASGAARVVLRANVNAPTQVALLRATDVMTGQQITGSFIIAQLTNGEQILSVLPSSISLTGPDATHCSTGVPVSYYIFGGTPPYRVVASLPSFVVMTQPTIVAVNGGGFTITTNGSCFDEETFVVTDATGRTVTATLSSGLGGGGGGGGGGLDCSFSPPNPACFPQAIPNALTLTTCTEVATATISGATLPYTFTAPSNSGVTTAGSSGNTLRVQRTSGPATSPVIITVSSQNGFSVTIPVTLLGAAAGPC